MPTYPYLRAYALRIGWTKAYTHDMLTLATKEGAPPNAVFRRLNSTWATVDEIGTEEQEKIVQHLKHS